MAFRFTFLVALIFSVFSAFATDPTITPVVSPTSFCTGDTMTIIIQTSDTFPTGNTFHVYLSNGVGGLATAQSLGTITGQGNDTLQVLTPAVTGGNNYIVAVRSTDTTLGLSTTPLSIGSRPVVTFSLPQNSYCTYTNAVQLAGGSPTGGVYSGTYVQNGLFSTSQSGAGSFDVYYTVTNFGCSATDTAAITVTTCPAPSVSLQANPSSFCAGSVVNINIQASSTLAYDNVFTVYLSDSSGSFTNATVLAVDSSTTGGIIQVIAPSEPVGSHYKIGVTASDPATTGVSANVVYRTLLSAPSIAFNVSSDSLNLCTKDSFKLKVDSVRGVSYVWTFNGNPLTVHGYTYLAKDSGAYVVKFTDTTANGCSYGKDSVFIGIYPYLAKPAISPTGTVKRCGVSSLLLSTTGVNGATYQWANHGVNIAGATQTSYTADSTGVYLVKAISNHGCITKSDSVRIILEPNPVVTFTLPSSSYCLNSPEITLYGGLPYGSGGYYSGTHVEHGSSFNQTESGTGAFKIYYTFIDSFGCSGTDSTTINIADCTSAGIENVENTHSFQMYPNPAAGSTFVSLNEAGTCKLRLINLIGKELYTAQFSQNIKLYTGNLAAGVYMVEVSDANETWKTVRRLVVQ